MPSDTTLVKPAGAGHADTRLEPAVPAPARFRPGPRTIRFFRLFVLVLAVFVSGLCLLTVFASWRDDASISAHPVRTDADVLSVAFNRTAVRFVTPDGMVHIPANGVLYPEGLAAGERVQVEYDGTDPELVRVAGRDFTLSFLPAGTTLLGVWAVAIPLLWWSKRKLS